MIELGVNPYAQKLYNSSENNANVANISMTDDDRDVLAFLTALKHGAQNTTPTELD